MTERLLTIKEAAEALRLGVPTLRKWRYEGYGPQSFRIGKRVVYREADIEAFIAEALSEASA